MRARHERRGWRGGPRRASSWRRSRATASGDAERKALADSEAERRAKEIKRRRVQVQQAHKMAEFVALHVIMASVTTPTDREQAEADLKLAQRLGARAGRFGRP